MTRGMRGPINVQDFLDRLNEATDDEQKKTIIRQTLSSVGVGTTSKVEKALPVYPMPECFKEDWVSGRCSNFMYWLCWSRITYFSLLFHQVPPPDPINDMDLEESEDDI